MLPTEIILKTCENLTRKDILALSETNCYFRDILKSIRDMLLASPYYRVHLSDCDSLQSCANNFTPRKEEPYKFEEGHIETRVNQPLPADFVCLEGFKEPPPLINQAWYYCDFGIISEKTAEVLDLRAGPDFVTSLPPFEPVAHSEEAISAEVDELEGGGAVLTVESHDNTIQRHLLSDIGDADYYVNVVQDMVFVNNNHSANSGPCYFTKEGRHNLKRVFSPENVEAWMLYNGLLHKVVKMGYSRDVLVASPDFPYHGTCGTPLQDHYFVQDERNPRYALGYSRPVAYLTHVFDLKEKTVFTVDEDNGYYCIPGLSQGKLGLWMYSEGYLHKKAAERALSMLPDVEFVFEQMLR